MPMSKWGMFIWSRRGLGLYSGCGGSTGGCHHRRQLLECRRDHRRGEAHCAPCSRAYAGGGSHSPVVDAAGEAEKDLK